MDAVGEEERPVAPGAEEVAIAVEDDDRRVFALKGVDPILGVGGHGADHGEAFSRGQLGPVLDQRIGVLASAYCRHLLFPPTWDTLQDIHGPSRLMTYQSGPPIVPGIQRAIIALRVPAV